MQHILASISQRLETAAGRGDSWWSSLTPAQQKKYIKEHPTSKYAKSGGKASQPAAKPVKPKQTKSPIDAESFVKLEKAPYRQQRESAVKLADSLDKKDLGKLKSLYDAMTNSIIKANKLSGPARNAALDKAQGPLADWIAEKVGLDKDQRKGTAKTTKFLADIAGIMVHHKKLFD